MSALDLSVRHMTVMQAAQEDYAGADLELIFLNGSSLRVETIDGLGHRIAPTEQRGTGMPSTAKPLIHVVDDDASMRNALLMLLGEVGFDTRGYASTGEFLLEPVPDRPGCLLLDLTLPGPSGLDLQAALQRQNCMLPIVFLTGNATVTASVRAMKAGAVDFLTKPVQREVLLEAIERALASDAAHRRANEAVDQLQLRFASLTPRQRVVFERIVAGKLNKQIADELGIAERTVKREREQVMSKVHANSAADLGRLAGLREHFTET